MPKTDPTWSLVNIPPKGHKDVADFAYSLFEIARLEKERLGKPQDFLANYALYRGKQSIGSTTVTKAYTPVNLFFSNIERTVSNITARNPVGEVVDLDGIKDGAEEVFTVKLQKWWKNTSEQGKTRASARTMEIYGVTIEKPCWDKDKDQPDILVTDPFAFFPAPGLYDDLSTDPPYVCFAYLDFVDQAEKTFGVKGIAQDDAYELLGVEREKYKADNYVASNSNIGNYSDPMTRSSHNDRTASDAKVERCLIIEVWVKDLRTKTVKEESCRLRWMSRVSPLKSRCPKKSRCIRMGYERLPSAGARVIKKAILEAIILCWTIPPTRTSTRNLKSSLRIKPIPGGGSLAIPPTATGIWFLFGDSRQPNRWET